MRIFLILLKIFGVNIYMRKNSTIDFTAKTSRGKGLGKIVLIVAGVIFLGLVSFVVILAINDFDTAKFLGTRIEGESTTAEPTTLLGEQTTAPAFSDSNSVNVLFICHDSKKVPTFCQVISVSYAENVIRVKPVSPDITVESRGKKLTVGELFTLSGTGAVCEALEARGISVTRHITADETNFKMLLQKLGSVEITLPHEVSYSVDAITYSFPEGKTVMTADTLVKYMKYSAAGDELLTVQANVLAQILRTHLTAENINKGEEFFSRLINLVSGNITAFDFTDNREKIARFLEKNPPVNVIT